MWARKAWEIEVSIKTNPLTGGSSDEEDSAPSAARQQSGNVIDATQDSGLAYLSMRGLPVKPLPDDYD